MHDYVKQIKKRLFCGGGTQVLAGLYLEMVSVKCNWSGIDLRLCCVVGNKERFYNSSQLLTIDVKLLNIAIYM